MSAAAKHLEHGTRIYAYHHIKTNQVVYSLDRVLDNTTVLKQLPFAGKKSVPAALRKDHWKPFFVVKFGYAHQGLNAFKKLREWRKLHELSWDPKDVIKSYVSEAAQLEREKRREHQEKVGGFRVGGARRSITEWRRRVKGTIMNQKANSVADLAAVLVEQEAKFAAWSPEREKLYNGVLEWLPKLVTDGAERKVRLAKINEEITALEQKIKDVKATSGKKWELPLASKVTNLNRELKLKKTEYYQISHLPEIFDLSKFAQSALFEKSVHFEALCEKEFIVRWQQAKLDNELLKLQQSSSFSDEEVVTLEQKLFDLEQQLETQASTVRELQTLELVDDATEDEIKSHRRDLRKAVQSLHELRGDVLITKGQLLQTGKPPAWLKHETYGKRVHEAVERLLRINPKLSGASPLQRAEIEAAIEAVDELPTPAVPADTSAPGADSATAGTALASPAAQTTNARDIRAAAQQTAIKAMRQLQATEKAAAQSTDSNDTPISLGLHLPTFGRYIHHTTWLTIFPNWFTTFLSSLTSISPGINKETSMSSVSIEWSDPLNAEFGREWPAAVSHLPMGVVRHTARNERFAPRSPAVDTLALTARGTPIAQPAAASLVPELQPRAANARAKAILQRAQAAHMRSNRALSAVLADERARLQRVVDRHARGPVGKALRAAAKEDLATLQHVRLPDMYEGKDVAEARETLEAARRRQAAQPPVGERRRGMGHYGVVGLGSVRVVPRAVA